MNETEGLVMRFLGLGFFCLICFWGCSASLSQKDCASVDWYSKGQDDVKQGLSVTRFYEYQKICAKIGVKPSEEQYVKGFMDGQKTYCTYDNGYKAAKQGKRPGEVCPNTSDYIAGFVEGRKAYEEEKERRQVENLTRPSSGLGSVSVGSGGP